MNKGGGSEGVNRLARALQQRMQMISDRPPILDFGEIQGDMSLVTNNFPVPIPRSDYMVCRSVTWGDAREAFFDTEIDTENDTDPVLDISLGAKFRWIQPGDRVLVAWVGDDACVIDLIFPATVVE